jgi:glutaminase
VTPDNFRLLYSAQCGDLPLMKSLQFKKWKVNAFDYDGRTALGLAASEGHYDIVVYLISHGADVSHVDARGNDALADSIRGNHVEVTKFLE